MKFEDVLYLLRRGQKFKRRLWDAKIMGCPSSDFQCPVLEGRDFLILIEQYDEYNEWVPTQDDIIAEDWELVRAA